MIPKEFPPGTTFTVGLWPRRPREFLMEEYRKGAWSFNKGYRMISESDADRAFGNIAPLLRQGVLVQDLLYGEHVYYYAGLDPAGVQRPGNALAVVGVQPTSGLRVICHLGIWRGSFAEMNSQVVGSYARFKWQVCSVENNGVQATLKDALVYANRELPLAGFLTATNKAHPEFGVPGLAAEIENGLWALAMDDPYDTGTPLNDHFSECTCAYHEFIQDVLNYPSPGRKYDLLMAWWFAREAVRGALSAFDERRRAEERQEDGGVLAEGRIPLDELGGAFLP